MAETNVSISKKINNTIANQKIESVYIKKDRKVTKKITSNFSGNNSGIGFNLLVAYGL